MRAVWITKHGGPEVLAVRESPDPAPLAGDVRIRVRAAGLNFAEVLARKGLYPDAPKTPCVVGYEGAGIVDAVGPDVEGLSPGMRVLYLSRFGGHAPTAEHEILYRFEFPERPGALMRFLDSMSAGWNISLFHYRNHGADYGRVLVGMQVPPRDSHKFRRFLDRLGYDYVDESANPAYRMFLGR